MVGNRYQHDQEKAKVNLKNPTKSYFAKKGGGATHQRRIHDVRASEIEVTRRDLVHSEYSLKKSDCCRQICGIGEPRVVVCRHRSCRQCRHEHKGEVCAEVVSTSTLRAARKRHAAGLPRSVP
jgi:hypothetical protein